MFSVPRLCPNQSFFSLCYRHHVAALCMLCKVNSNSIIVFSVSFHLLLPEFDIPSCDRSSFIEVRVSRCRMFQFARCFLPAQARMWNDLPFEVFNTKTFDGFNGAVNRWLFPRVVFFLFSAAHVLVGLRKQFINNLIFPTGPALLILIIIIIIMENL